jgi:hypothetical protein
MLARHSSSRKYAGLGGLFPVTSDLRSASDAERPDVRFHAERGNEVKDETTFASPNPPRQPSGGLPPNAIKLSGFQGPRVRRAKQGRAGTPGKQAARPCLGGGLAAISLNLMPFGLPPFSWSNDHLLPHPFCR